MASPRKLEYTALGGLFLQAIFLLGCWILADHSGSQAVAAETWHMVPGLLVWLVVLVHGRQRRLAHQEREELEQLKQARLSDEIFEETELDTMRASAGLLFFEKYLVPLLTLVLSGGLLFLAYRAGSTVLAAVGRYEVGDPITVVVSMVFIAFVGFVIGKYASGLSQSPGYRLLRASGGYMLGNVIACVLIIVAMTLYHFGMTWGETVVALLIPLIMALAGLELILNLVLDIYRPRVPGQERRPPYDSRLLGLFAEPEDVLKTVAATLDYQFGFKVSETWFYRFMERAIVPLALIQILSLWLLTIVVVVDPHEVAFVEVLGKPDVSLQDREKGLPATPLEPGFHLKWPWPFAISRFAPVYQVQSVELGKVYEEKPGGWDFSKRIALMRDPDFILWRERHIDPAEGYEANFLIPSTVEVEEQVEPPAAMENRAPRAEAGAGVEEKTPKVNLARVLAQVHFRVRQKPDGKVDERAAFTYTYQQKDVREHVERLAYRALCRIAASQDFLRWIAEDRGETTERFERMVREATEERDLGVEIIWAAIPVVHPPPETAAAYEDVVTALEQRESLILEGQAERAKIVADAEASSSEETGRAISYAANILENARAESDQFLVQLTAYAKAPLVYMFRSYFDTMEFALGGQALYVVPMAQSLVDIIDLKPPARSGLLNLDATEE